MRDALEDPGIDSVILDLEDLVTPSRKNVARARVCEAVATGAFQRKGVEVVVRINAPDTPFARGACPADHHQIVDIVQIEGRVRRVDANNDLDPLPLKRPRANRPRRLVPGRRSSAKE